MKNQNVALSGFGQNGSDEHSWQLFRNYYFVIKKTLN
jgi:hypothetical protein